MKQLNFARNCFLNLLTGFMPVETNINLSGLLCLNVKDHLFIRLKYENKVFSKDKIKLEFCTK